jgi:UDP-glucuronate decarboxylase
VDLAHKIVSLTQSSSSIIHKPLPQDDPVRRCPDISLAREKLNWKTLIPLEEGLKETIAYFRNILRET